MPPSTRHASPTTPRRPARQASSPGRSYSRTATLAAHKGPWKHGEEQLKNEVVSSRGHARKHFEGHLTGEHTTWNYLKAGSDTPAGQHMYYAEEKKNWKPKWKHKRPEEKIDPYGARTAYTETTTKCREGASTQRHERLSTWNTYNEFNPISHEARDAATGTWREATDGWQHRRVHVKNNQAPTQNAVQKEEAANARSSAVATLRRERIAREGLTTTRKPNDMRAILQWDP